MNDDERAALRRETLADLETFRRMTEQMAALFEQHMALWIDLHQRYLIAHATVNHLDMLQSDPRDSIATMIARLSAIRDREAVRRVLIAQLAARESDIVLAQDWKEVES